MRKSWPLSSCASIIILWLMYFFFIWNKGLHCPKACLYMHYWQQQKKLMNCVHNANLSEWYIISSFQICIKLLKVTQWEKWKIKLHSAAIFFIFIFLLIRAAELKKLTIHTLGEEIDTLINCWYKSKMMSLHREDSFILNKTRHLPFEPAIILVGIYPTIHFHKYKPLW